MTKKIGKKSKIGGIESTDKASEVAGTSAVGEIQTIKPTGAVSGVGKAGGIGRRGPTRIMSMQERQELLRLIDEEAEKMFGPGANPEKKQAVVNAVKMAVDSGIEEEQ